MGTCSSSKASGTAGAGKVPILSKDLVRRANEASVTDIGDITTRQYKRNIDEINATVLSDIEKADAISKLHTLTEAQLKAEASTINPLATGRGVARFDRQLVRTTGDQALDARREVKEFMDTVHAKERETIAKRKQQAMTSAMTKALSSGALEFTIDGAKYRRKSKRAKSFERVYD